MTTSRIAKAKTSLQVLGLVLPVLAAWVGVALLTFGLMSRVSNGANDVDAARARQIVSSALHVAQQLVRDAATDNAYWDPAAENMYGRPNADWFDETFASSNSGIYDAAFLVDGRAGDILLGEKAGAPFLPSPGTYFKGGLFSLLTTLPANPTTFGATATIMETEDGLAIIGAATIMPTSAEVSIEGQTPRYLLFLRYLNRSYLDQLERQYVLRGLQVLPVSDRGSGATLTDLLGNPVARVRWVDEKPGDAALTSISGLSAAVLGGLGVTMLGISLFAFHILRRLRRRERQALHSARHDPLTGLPNRAAMLSALAASFESSAGFSGALMFVDLDDFKRINDLYGHASGDAVLRQVTERIWVDGLLKDAAKLEQYRGAISTGSFPLDETIFARFAGDEFVILLPKITDTHALGRIAGRVIAAMQQPFDIGAVRVGISASVGIARSPTDTSNVQQLLAFADLAMYAAKRDGKSRFRLFDGEVRQTLLARQALEQDLQIAIAKRQFVLHFQPKVHSQSLEVMSVEALVRWNHPGRGLVFPGEFIEVAEQSGLMHALGDLILELAVEQSRRWIDAGTPTSIAVNISPLQFREQAFVADFSALLAAHGVPASLFELEITESVAMDDAVLATEKITALRATGVRTAIDDFGVGHSNLNQLVNLPFDTLKIDRSLVSAIGESERSECVIIALIGIAAGLGYETVAEGIETPEQYAFLRQYGCSTIQGYYFARPMPAEQFEVWRETRRDSPALQLQDQLQAAVA